MVEVDGQPEAVVASSVSRMHSRQRHHVRRGVALCRRQRRAAVADLRVAERLRDYAQPVVWELQEPTAEEEYEQRLLDEMMDEELLRSFDEWDRSLERLDEALYARGEPSFHSDDDADHELEKLLNKAKLKVLARRLLDELERDDCEGQTVREIVLELRVVADAGHDGLPVIEVDPAVMDSLRTGEPMTLLDTIRIAGGGGDPTSVYHNGPRPIGPLLNTEGDQGVDRSSSMRIDEEAGAKLDVTERPDRFEPL